MKLLEMKGISKAFGGEKALINVDFNVEEGEIHALLGENGAGKSTLMNILTGVLPADAGTIFFDGKEYPEPTITGMEKAGIAFVHQELNVINDLTVTENIFLRREIAGPFGFLKKKEMLRQTTELFESLGVNMDPTMMVSELKAGEKQILEISRALHMDAQLLILDEPTTALSNDEIEHLFDILKNLKSQGKSFIFISHKMPEIFGLADRYTVLRNGEYISSGNIEDVTPHEVTSDMVGAAYVDKDVYVSRELGEPILELRKFSGPGFTDVSLTVNKGEIVAFTGLAGSGASELMQAMFGALESTGGAIIVNGERTDGNIKSFMRHGVAMLPSNRKENSVIPDLNILENMYVAEHNLTPLKQVIKQKEELEKFAEFQSELNIKAQNPIFAISTLSGGNQQKVFLARWLNTGADILLLDNPTQGVDVGAKAEIYRLILELAEEGKTILINTLEIPEIKKVSDRCVVFYAGEIVKVLSHDEIEEHKVMLYSTNAINMEVE